MAQPGDPVNDFIEFVQVWGGVLSNYLEAVIMYDLRRRSKYICCVLFRKSEKVSSKHFLEKLQGLRFK